LPSGSKAGLPLNVAQPQSMQKWCATLPCGKTVYCRNGLVMVGSQ
jgi:hypothetical protein